MSRLQIQDKERLLLAQEWYSSSSSCVVGSKFRSVNKLFERARKKKQIDNRIVSCRKCGGMNYPAITECSVGVGDLLADVMFVGQSLCTACMSTRMPFTMGSGYLIDAALFLSGLDRKDVFITNVVHCHPPNNRKSEAHEIKNCVGYLIEEIMLVKPKVIFKLGKDASKWVDYCLEQVSGGMSLFGTTGFKCETIELVHPASLLYTKSSQMRWIINLSEEIDKYV